MQHRRWQTESTRLVAWSWQTRIGLDVAAVMRHDDGIVVEGRVQTEWDGDVLELAYRLECGDDWPFRALQAVCRHSGAVAELSLRRDGATWRAGAQQRDDLREAAYIDIMATPITNTLPIENLTWTPGVSREITMAYVCLPTLTVEPVRQRYTLLNVDADGSRRFLYQTLGSVRPREPAGGAAGHHGQDTSFSAELLVDAEGLVLCYPPYWRRMTAAEALPAPARF